MALRLALTICTTIGLVSGTVRYNHDVASSEPKSAAEDECIGVVSADLVLEIQGYQEVADQIIEAVIHGEFKGRAYDDLAELVDKYPKRPSGSQFLEDAIDFMMDKMTKDYKLENVRAEEVAVPNWVRGQETAEMVEPLNKTIALLGLGRSVGTPEDGLSAEAVVVRSYEDLDERYGQDPDSIQGKIVVFNQGWLGTYGATKVYRQNGASYASQYGAVAVLIQSVTPFSINSPHTGAQVYWDNVTQIPVACITMEDAELMYRLQSRGEKITINLKMMDENLPMTSSRNVIGEISGHELPEEFVAVSGHIDSWDVGQGAMDDGGGVIISAVALAVLQHLNLKPKRTLQAILWTVEEMGLFGAKAFAEQHKDILGNYSAVFESDDGTFRTVGLDFAGTKEAGCIVAEILKLSSSINATKYQKFESVGSDIGVLIELGVPGISLNNAEIDDMYMWYHHTEGDTMTIQDTIEMDLDTALWAVSSYVLADLSIPLPR